ncbi:MAG: hypothetical protein JRG89_17605 [Deltaproteobacteria bacterium]|nr:hypothetical protein [Deltaproteobacteria bacterium]
MAGTEIVQASDVGWLESLESRPGGFLGLGLALAALIITGMLLWWLAFGFWPTLFDSREPFGISFDARNHLTMALLIAFVWPASRWVRRETLRSLQDLERMSTLPAEVLAELVKRASLPSIAARVVSISAATLLGVVIIALTSNEPGTYLDVARWDAHHIWAIGNNVVLFTIMFQGAFGLTTAWKALDHVSRSLSRVDLLDRDGVAQIGRFGLPSAFLWLVGSSIASFLAWGMQNVWPLIGILSMTLALATFSLLRPAQIVHRRLAAAKRTELERVRERIATAKEAVLSLEEDSAHQASLLAGLLAYELRIESVRDWPFDTPTLVRFGALALLAVGSWLGGAVVERALGAILE